MDLPLHAPERKRTHSMSIMTVMRQFLAAGFLIVIGLIAYGCGDTASVNSSAELASLAVDPGSLEPGFSGGITQYTVNLSSSITSVTITAQPAVGGDTVTINGLNTTSSVITLDEAGTTTSVSIVVSGSGANPGGYTVRFVRAGLTGNNSLQNLAVSPGPLASPFDPNLQTYTVDVANTVQRITVTPTLSDPAATMTVNGQATNSGQARTITLNPAGQDTAIPIVVTAQNGNPKTYTVTVSRGVSGDFNLQRLTVEPGTLAPPFRSGTLGYTVNLPSTAGSITVTPTLPPNTSASMTVNNRTTRSGQGQTFSLGEPGSSISIPIVVTAQNGSRNTYLVVVNRAESSNNNLSALSVRAGNATQTLSPSFTSGTLPYTTSVDPDVTSVTVSATKSDSTAVMAIGSVTVPAGTRTGQTPVTLGGQGSDTPVSITVTAPSGTPKTYRVTIHREEPSSNNNLSALSVRAGNATQTLSPSFTSGTLPYTTSVDPDVTSVTVSATKSDSTAVMAIGSVTVPAGTRTGQTPVTLGGQGSDTPVSITVTAPSGTPKTYRVTIHREELAVPRTPANAPDLIKEDDTCPLVIPPDPLNPDPDGCSANTSRSDNITNVSTPRFRIPQPGAEETPNLLVDGNNVGETFDRTANTLQPTQALSDGAHTITYTLTNAGGTSSPSPPLSVEINTTVAPPGGGP